MPSAATLRRAWLHPRKTYARPLLGQRPLLGPLAVVEASAFRPGVRFDLLDDRGNRLGWGRVTALGDIELFDAASNRLGGIRPTFRAFAENGRKARTYAPPIEALKEGEVLEIGPEGKRGVWRSIGGNPIFIEVQKGESVPKAVRRAQGETRRGERSKEPTPVQSIVSKTDQSLPLSDLRRKFGVYNPGRFRQLFDKMEQDRGAFYRAVAGEAWVLPGTLEAASPVQIAKLWQKSFQGKFKNTAEAASFMTQARQQSGDAIALTQWALSKGGKIPAVTLYRGFTKGQAMKSSHVISFWTDRKDVAAGYAGKSGFVMEATVPVGHILSSWNTSGGRLKDSLAEYLVNRGFTPSGKNSRKIPAGDLRFSADSGEANVLAWAPGTEQYEFPRGLMQEEDELAAVVGRFAGLIQMGMPLDSAMMTALFIMNRNDETPIEGGAPMTGIDQGG